MITFAEYLRLDAGEQREHLARLYADAIAAGGMSHGAWRSLLLKARRLARRVGLELDDVIAVAREDAVVLAEEDR